MVLFRMLAAAFLGWSALTTALSGEWDSLILPEKLPASPQNKVADRLEAAELGQRLYFDARLSPAGVQCVSCHIPENGYADKRAVSKGIREVTRNAPTLLNAAYLSRFFWDGRAATLWEQPLITLIHPDEMAATPLGVAHLIDRVYRDSYEKLFGALPSRADFQRFPASGGPGTSAFDSLKSADRAAVTQIFENVGKSFEAYVRKLAGGKAPFDLYLAGDTQAVSAEAVRGFKTFQRVGCVACHSGALYTDQKFHRLGIPDRDPAHPDLGYQESGAFRTPSLRNLMQSEPYFHDGSAQTLEQVLDRHVSASRAKPKLDPLFLPLTLSKSDRQALIAFLRSLQGSPPRMPWFGWPYR